MLRMSHACTRQPSHGGLKTRTFWPDSSLSSRFSRLPLFIPPPPPPPVPWLPAWLLSTEPACVAARDIAPSSPYSTAARLPPSFPPPSPSASASSSSSSMAPEAAVSIRSRVFSRSRSAARPSRVSSWSAGSSTASLPPTPSSRPDLAGSSSTCVAARAHS